MKGDIGEYKKNAHMVYGIKFAKENAAIDI